MSYPEPPKPPECRKIREGRGIPEKKIPVLFILLKNWFPNFFKDLY